MPGGRLPYGACRQASTAWTASKDRAAASETRGGSHPIDHLVAGRSASVHLGKAAPAVVRVGYAVTPRRLSCRGGRAGLGARRFSLSLRRPVVPGVSGSPAQLDEFLQAGEGVWEPARVLVAELGGGESPLGHRHERLFSLRLERELELGVEGRSVEARLGGGEYEAVWPLDHFEHVPVLVELKGGGTEVHGPDATDAQVALRPNDPAGIVLAVERLLALGIGERVEDLLGRGVDQSRELDVEPHRPTPWLCST